MENHVQDTSLIVQLENNKTNHDFMNYSNEDKNIIISSGLAMFNSGHRDLSASNDSKIKNIIVEMEKNHQEEISILNSNISKIKQTNENEINKRIRELQDSHSKSFRDFQAEIESLSNANRKLRENDNWKDYQKLILACTQS